MGLFSKYFSSATNPPKDYSPLCISMAKTLGPTDSPFHSFEYLQELMEHNLTEYIKIITLQFESLILSFSILQTYVNRLNGQEGRVLTDDLKFTFTRLFENRNCNPIIIEAIRKNYFDESVKGSPHMVNSNIVFPYYLNRFFKYDSKLDCFFDLNCFTYENLFEKSFKDFFQAFSHEIIENRNSKDDNITNEDWNDDNPLLIVLSYFESIVNICKIFNSPLKEKVQLFDSNISTLNDIQQLSEASDFDKLKSLIFSIAITVKGIEGTYP